MFERFTDRARRSVVLAQAEARELNHNYIGTEHLLLGLLREGVGVAAKALDALGITLDAARSQVDAIIGRGAAVPEGHIPFTPRAKKVLELSFREALQLGHDYIGTEHILLGLAREGEGVAAQVLTKLGAGMPETRQTVIRLLSGQPSSQGEERPSLDPSASAALMAAEAIVEESMAAGSPVAPASGIYDDPRCGWCGLSAEEGAAYRTLTIPHAEGAGTHAVLFVFCTGCGRVFATHPTPEAG